MIVHETEEGMQQWDDIICRRIDQISNRIKAENTVLPCLDNIFTFPGMSLEQKLNWTENFVKNAEETFKEIEMLIEVQREIIETKYPEQFKAFITAGYAGDHEEAKRIANSVPPEHRGPFFGVYEVNDAQDLQKLLKKYEFGELLEEYRVASQNMLAGKQVMVKILRAINND